MENLTSSTMFGIVLSLGVFTFANFIYKKTKIALLNPLLTSIIFIIIILKVFKVDYNDFNLGGQIINLFITPATVALAIPLYKTFHLLKKHVIPILFGTAIGSFSGIMLIGILCKIFGVEESITKSMMPKSVTTAISMEISKQAGGLPPITIAIVIVTGVFGAVIAPLVLKVFKIHDPMAQGLAIGASSHAVGTSKAVEIGEIQGAMSGLSIGVCGIMTVFFMPLCIKILDIIFP